ncbi:polysaccharide pyruvyl transferase family protein, partial [Salinicoccus roseus]|uniref:polysaccharide pyruvyl transferase family protein n=1 Tax=Salinicoccus roseus TaxID=45670 RepID=UPI0039E7A40F
MNAYTNFNLGDDLFIKVLCERYPETNFLIYAPEEYKYTFKNIDNILIFPSNKLFNRIFNYILRKIKSDISIQRIISRKVDAIVQIGGSIFIERKKYLDSKVKKEKNVKKPYYVLGANFGPYQTEQFYKYHHELFQRYTDICFRDKYSYELFKDLRNVRMADDIIFQLSDQKKIASKHSVVISVIKPSFRENLQDYDEVYYKKIKDIAAYFLDKGYKVILMSFCEREGDKKAIEEISQLLPIQKRAYVYKYHYLFNMDEALDVIAASSFIVATRFHAMILGWAYNKPVFPIAYSEKMNNVMEDIGHTGTFINLKEIDKLNPDEVFESMKKNSVDISSQAKN